MRLRRHRNPKRALANRSRVSSGKRIDFQMNGSLLINIDIPYLGVLVKIEFFHFHRSLTTSFNNNVTNNPKKPYNYVSKLPFLIADVCDKSEITSHF